MKNLNIKRRDTLGHVLHIGSLILVFLVTFLALVLSRVVPVVHANNDSSVSTAKVTVAESCSISGVVDDPHYAAMYNGTYSGTDYANGIGKTVLEVYCNDSAGFAIYAIGYTGNEHGNTVLHSQELGNTYDIETGIYISGDTVNSTWSMKLISAGGASAPTVADGTNGTENFTTWHVVPDEYKKVAFKTSGTDMSTGTGGTLSTTYDAYVSDTQLAGLYVGQVKYTLVHPSTAGKPVIPLKPSDCPATSICYAPNANDVVGDMSSLGTTERLSSISPKTGVVTASSSSNVALIAPNFARPGYGFAGWSADFEVTSSSVIYGPNETILTGDLSEHGMILYPVWIASAGTMQDWNANGTNCNALTSIPASGRASLASMTALTDTRDGNVYTVAKLADGKCWMTENLRLNDSANITVSNTQSNGVSFGGVFVGLANSEDEFFSDVTNANTLYSTNANSIGSDNNPGYRFPRYNKNNTNMTEGAENSKGAVLADNYNTNYRSNARWYGYGNNYTWAAAVADTSYYSGENVNADDSSLCPSGWHLPEGGKVTASHNVTGNTDTFGEYYYLGYMIMGSVANNSVANNGNSYYNTSTLNIAGDTASEAFRKFPNNMVRSGYINAINTMARNTGGVYWSSTFPYSLFLNNNNLYPGTSGSYSAFYGASVRCVVDSE